MRIDALGYEHKSTPKERVAACNLCGESRFATIAHHDRYGFEAPTDACLRCGLVFQNPMMTAAACAGFYADIYRPLLSAFHGRRIDAQSVEVEQEPYAETLARLLRPALTPRNPKTLLDMGGSTGVVSARLAVEFGLEGTICDPSPDETDRATARDLEVVVGTAEDFDPGARTFDVILLCQTVDHLLDIRASLANLRRLISPDGIFFVDVVDFRAAYLRNWSVEDATKIDHPYYLTEATAEAFIAAAGFETMTVSYAADHLHIGYVCTATDPASRLPERASAARMLREVRYVQNVPPPS